MKKLLKDIFGTIFFAYKNIVHFFFSKILIVFISILVGFLAVLPLIIILFLVLYFFPGLNYSITLDFLRNILFFLFLYFVIFNFKLFISNLANHYIEGKKMKFNLKNYLNFSQIIKNIKISLFILLGIFLISLIFIALFWILVFIFGGVRETNTLLVSSAFNAFSIISLILAFLYFIILFYFLYRVYFSFYILLENEKKSALKIIEKSIKKTRKNKKIFKLIGILIVIFLIFLPFNYYYELNNIDRNNINNYINLKIKKINNYKLDEKEQIDYLFLDKKFGKLNEKELVEKYNKINKIYLLLFILNFIFIFGIFDLVMANFYKKEIK